MRSRSMDEFFLRSHTIAYLYDNEFKDYSHSPLVVKASKVYKKSILYINESLSFGHCEPHF